MPIYDTSDDVLIQGTDGADVIYGVPDPAQAPSDVIASGLYRPLFATAPDGDSSRLFVVSQGGTIKIHDLNNPQDAPEVFLNLGGMVNNNTEAGLLGFTFHPDCAANGKCYVNYTTPDNAEGTGRKQAIVEYTFDPNNLSTPPTSKTIMVIDYPQEHTHHRAGWLGFGPDRMLYIATGEDTVASNAQTVVNQDGSINHLGKILRIDVSGDDFPQDADRNYSIPDNPLAFDNIQGTLPQPSEIWAVGLRNPWRASFGPDGKLYVADVGQNTYEEINIVEAGKNYGWREAPVADGPQNVPGYTDPYYHYGRDVGGSVTGGYFYEGPGPLNGKYIFGDFNEGKIFAMDVSGDEPVVEDITNSFRDANGDPIQFGHLSSFGLDGQGNLYAISYADNTWGNDTGRIFRLSGNTPPTDGPDSIEGGTGNDTIYGGAGNDTIHGGEDDDYLYGEADNDRLYGDAGADTLDGGAGNDVLHGGSGDDTYIVDADGDTITEDADAGVDTVRSTVDFRLGANLENLTLEGSAKGGIGNALGNIIIGNGEANLLIGHAGNDILDGGAGHDVLAGGDGNDTYIVDDQDEITDETADGGIDTIVSSASHTLRDFLEHLTLNGTAAINGIGNGLDNEINGNSAANVLDGGLGTDTLRGGGGNDTYVVDGGDTIVEFSPGGVDTVVATVSCTLGEHLEKLVLRGTAVRGTGNTLNNTVTGNNAANILDGAGGADILQGGYGNDTYYIDNERDIIVEASGRGTDKAIAKVSYALGSRAYVETLEAARGTRTIDLTGNAFANKLVGNSGINGLYGGTGNDSLYGNTGNDLLVGGSGNDMLSGGTGNDRLVGGTGRDTFTGGTGRDVFIFDDRETSSSKSRADTITDFSGRSRDRIDLGMIDADTKKRGDQAFSFIGKEDAFSKAGQVRYEKAKGYTYVYLNTDADKSAEAVIKLKGSTDLSKGWFAL